MYISLHAAKTIRTFTFAFVRPERIYHQIVFLIFMAGWPLCSWSQVQAPPTDTTGKGGVILIDHFGKLIEDIQGIETVKWISKGLQLRIDSTNIYADSAVIFGEDRVFAYGNVVIQQGDSLEVFTDTLYYTREEDIAELIGEVALRQGDKQLWTTNLSYHLGERFGEYHQGGVLVDKDLQVSSKKGIYWADQEEIRFEDSVVVLHPQFNLAADSMRYIAPQDRVLFTGPTTIYTDESQIYCESGFYDLKNDVSEFNRNAQYVDGQKKGTADTIRYLARGGEVIMIGNVVVGEADRRITGDELQYFEKSGETWIKGDPAHYADSVRTVNSPEIRYNEKTQKVTTVGRGAISDEGWILESDQSTYDQVTGTGQAEGNVVWKDTISDVVIHSDVMDFDKKEEYVLAFNRAGGRPWFASELEGDTLFIAADTLEMWNQVDTLLKDTIRMIQAFRDVRLYKSDLQGRTDSLVFQGRDSVFTFYGRPLLWSDTTQFSADTITVSLREKKMDKITLIQKAMILSSILKTYYDQIKGKLIVARFDSSAIQDMLVTGNAESIYYTRDEDDAFIGVNKTICSKMFFTFLDGQIDALKYYGENTSNLIPMKEADHTAMRLDGFNWMEDERPLTFDDLLK